MKRLVYVALLSFLFPTLTIPDDHPNTKGVITLINDGFAHACPCDGKVFTAGHVIEGRQDEELRSFLWEDGYGSKGKANGKTSDDYRDLGTLDLKGPDPRYYLRASSLPQKSEKVYWEEFDDSGFESEIRNAKVLYNRAGYLFFDATPTPGASGTCLFNASGEVVGIVVWGIYKGGKRSGAATIIIDY